MDSNNDLEFYIKIIGAPGTIRRFGTANPTIVSRRLGGGSHPGDPVFALTDATEFGPYVWHGGWSTFERLWEDLTRQWRTLTVRLEVLGPPQRNDPELWGSYGVTTVTWKGGREVDFAFSDDPDEIAACEWTLRVHGPDADARWEEALITMLDEDAMTVLDSDVESVAPPVDITPDSSDATTFFEMRVQARQDLDDEDINPSPPLEEPESWEQPDDDYVDDPDREDDSAENHNPLPDDLPF